MKETKVYVDELPKTCWDCPCQINKYCGVLECDVSDEMFDNIKYKYCPLICIKDHDRELVKKVCEKIRKTIASTVDLAESNQQIKDQFHIILDQIQKEFENE